MSEVMASLVVSADALADALKKFKNIVPKPTGYGSAVMRDNILLCFTQDYKLCLYAESYENSLKVVVETTESYGLSSLVVSYSGLVAAVSQYQGSGQTGRGGMAHRLATVFAATAAGSHSVWNF